MSSAIIYYIDIDIDTFITIDKHPTCPVQPIVKATKDTEMDLGVQMR